MTNTLIIAGNRGISFALVNEIAAQDPSGTIFATTRNPSDSAELNELASKSNGKIIVIKCDMIDEESVKAAAAEISKTTETLDQVYINAGVMLGFGTIDNVSSSDLLDNMNANVVGPHNIFKAFAPFVLKSKASKRTIAVTSSLLGSIGALPRWAPPTKKPYGFESTPVACYAISKTAVNGLVAHWADHLEPAGIAVVAVHPGLVKTRMGENLKDGITPEESAQGYYKVVQGVEVSKTKEGIYSYDGSVLPW